MEPPMFTRLLGVMLLALALPLGGCAEFAKIKAAVTTVTGLTVPQKDVAAAVQAFNATEKAVTKYLLLPTCSADQGTITDACKQASSIPAIARDLKAGRAARDKLWSASVADPNGVGATTLVSAVIAAVSALNADIAN
jgi:hypothetical protein